MLMSTLTKAMLMSTLTWPLPGIDNSVATHGGVVAYRAGVMEPLQVVLVCVKTCSSCCIIDSSCKWASGSCWLASFVNQHWCGKEHQGSCAGVSQPAYFNIPFFTGIITLKDASSVLFLSEMVSSTHLIYSYHSHFHFHIDSLPRQSEGATQVPARNSAACARGNAPGQRRQDQASSQWFFLQIWFLFKSHEMH